MWNKVKRERAGLPFDESHQRIYPDGTIERVRFVKYHSDGMVNIFYYVMNPTGKTLREEWGDDWNHAWPDGDTMTYDIRNQRDLSSTSILEARLMFGIKDPLKTVIENIKDIFNDRRTK
jgi:hypothetical protein